MSSDEIRRLIGSYATGSLSEAERTMLFQAALEDQDLFEELAREQELKELIDTPGARQRLIAVLQEKSKPVRQGVKLWPWSIGAIAVAGALIAIFWFRPSPKPVEIASTAQTVQSVPEPAPQALPPRQTKRVVTAAPPTVKEPDAVKEEVEEKLLPPPELPKAAPALPPPPPVQPNGFVARNRDALTVAASARIVRFAFDYSLGPQGQLRITPQADGYLYVYGDPTQSLIAISGAQDGRVRGGDPIVVQVPEGTDAVRIQFSATPGFMESETFNRRETPSGTIEDPNPSPRSRLSISVPRQ